MAKAEIVCFEFRQSLILSLKKLSLIFVWIKLSLTTYKLGLTLFHHVQFNFFSLQQGFTGNILHADSTTTLAPKRDILKSKVSENGKRKTWHSWLINNVGLQLRYGLAKLGTLSSSKETSLIQMSN